MLLTNCNVTEIESKAMGFHLHARTGSEWPDEPRLALQSSRFLYLTAPR